MKKNKLWFKRRRYGYGWTPITKEGWLVTLAFIVSILISSFVILKDVERNTFQSESIVFIFTFIIILFMFLMTVSKKAPRPKWRWGKKPGDDPKLDF